MAKVSALTVKAILDKPVAVEDDQLAELCNDLALSLSMGGDLNWEIRHYLKRFTDSEYPVDEILVWSNEGKYGND